MYVKWLIIIVIIHYYFIFNITETLFILIGNKMQNRRIGNVYLIPWFFSRSFHVSHSMTPSSILHSHLRFADEVSFLES
jgi:hypothetical protein